MPLSPKLILVAGVGITRAVPVTPSAPPGEGPALTARLPAGNRARTPGRASSCDWRGRSGAQDEDFAHDVKKVRYTFITSSS
jgi:hypothetical protein